MGKYLAGIDIGTTGSRCCIFDLDGNLVSMGYREYACIYPAPGQVEQNGEELLEQTFEACKEALEEVDAEEVDAIGFSTQRTVLGPVDENNNPLRPFIGWQDSRGADAGIIEKEIKDKFDPREYYEITGMSIDDPVLILSKLIWLRRNEPEVYENAEMFTQNQDFFLRAFGADGHYVDEGFCPLFGFFDADKKEYSKEIMDAFDIPRKKLPEPTEAGTQVGTIDKEVAEATGFAEGTPICVGAGDQNAAVIGAGVVEEGMASVTLGTAGLCIAYSPEAVRGPKGKLQITGHAATGKWQAEGISLAAASSYRWFRDTFCNLEKPMGELLDEDSYNLMNKQIENVPPGANGVYFMPYLAGAGSPRYNSKATGSIMGLDFSHGKANIIRAVMEGITMEMRDIMENQKEAGIDIEEYRITGGATKSDLWNQLQADVYGKPVQLLKVGEASALGAAILAGKGVGIFEDIYEGVDQMVETVGRFEPNPKNAETYDDLYELYDETYNSLNNKGEVYNLHLKHKNKLAERFNEPASIES